MKTIIDAVNYFKGEYTYDSNFLYFDENGFFGSHKDYSVDENNYYICSREEFNQCVKEMMTNFNTSPTYSEYSGMLKVATELAEKHKQSVFTKEMQDAGKLPEVGMKVKHLAVDKFVMLTADANSKYVLKSVNDMYSLALLHDIEAIDNRTDKEKAMDDMWDSYRTCDKSALRPQIVVKLIEAIKSGKVHGVKWVGEQ